MVVPPKWTVYRQFPIEIDDLGGTPISGNLHIGSVLYIYIYIYIYM